MDITKHEHRARWPADTAGRHMTEDVPLAKPSQTLGEVQEQLSKTVHKSETIDFIYVIDDDRKLLGVFSIKDIYRHPSSITVERICKRDPLVKVKATTDQERTVYLALQHNLKSIPVVDNDDTFLGVVPNDTILSILYREMQEDLLRLSGIHHKAALLDNVLNLSLWTCVKHRIPWLLVGLVGGMCAAWVIGRFETTLEKNLILAAFIPLIVYMSDAVGTQMEAFMIRDLAIDRHIPFAKYFVKQLCIIAVIGIVFAALLFAATLALYGDIKISSVLSLSLCAAILSSVFSGLVIPQIFNHFKMDPANASGPIATIIQDLCSIIIYFGMASLLLS